jgi:cytochrome c-type biogenesis protein CcmH
MLWFTLTLMTVAAAIWMAAPFLQTAPEAVDGHNPDANVYRDQLAEVDRELRDGLIGPDQADAARVEIKRRLLALDRTTLPTIRRLSSIERTFFGRTLALVSIVAAMGLYLFNGNPDVPAQPRVAGTLANQPHQGGQFTPEALAAAGLSNSTAPQGAQPAAAPASTAAPQLAGVDEMIERLAARLAKSPNDPDGWRMLGWSYAGTERFAESAEAYGKAIELTPKIATLHTSRGEVLVRAADGRVTPDASGSFTEALKLDVNEPRARFFLGLAKEQAGDKKAALADWIAVLTAAAPGEEWVPDLAARVAELGKELGQDVSKVTGKFAEAPTAGAPTAAPAQGGVLARLNAAAARETSPARGPSADDMKAAEAMPDADRNAMIAGMVDGLEKRLDASPRDAEGWMKLIRSRMVLGQADKAKIAMDRALKTFANAPAERKQIADVAAELGLKR